MASVRFRLPHVLVCWFVLTCCIHHGSGKKQGTRSKPNPKVAGESSPYPKFKTKTASERFQALAYWLRTHGGTVNRKLVGSRIRKGLSGINVDGIISNGEIAADEKLMSVPLHLWMHSYVDPEIRDMDLLDYPECQAFREDQQNEFKLVLLLVKEFSKGEKSEYYGYLQLLPSMEALRSTLPGLLQDQGLLTDFGSLAVIAKIKRYQEYDSVLQKCYDAVKVSEVPWSDTNGGGLRFLYIARSRMFYNGGIPTLIPGLDFFNHEIRTHANIKQKVIEEEARGIKPFTIRYQFFTKRVIEDEEELMYSHDSAEDDSVKDFDQSPLDNSELFFRFGVYLEHNPSTLVDKCKALCQEPVDIKEGGSAESIFMVVARLLEVPKTVIAESQLDTGTILYPTCKHNTLSMEQGHMRCKLAMLTWEYCGMFWKTGKRPKEWECPKVNAREQEKEREEDESGGMEGDEDEEGDGQNDAVEGSEHLSYDESGEDDDDSDQTPRGRHTEL